MMIYAIEFIRRIPGREEPEVVDLHNMMASNIQDVIHSGSLSLRTIVFRVPPESFRIRENGGPIVFRSELSTVAS